MRDNGLDDRGGLRLLRLITSSGLFLGPRSIESLIDSRSSRRGRLSIRWVLALGDKSCSRDGLGAGVAINRFRENCSKRLGRNSDIYSADDRRRLDSRCDGHGSDIAAIASSSVDWCGSSRESRGRGG